MKQQNESEMAVDNNNGPSESSKNSETCLVPGEIILYRKSDDASKPDEAPDEGEIDDDIQVVKESDKNDATNGMGQFADEKFVEINRDKGEIAFLSVTNTGNQRIRV